ncbi:MAG: hypothetical protein Q8O25_14260 [Sulfurisoma sp.]|nr:hypothetical protein [Sulfurisoma sp.]
MTDTKPPSRVRPWAVAAVAAVATICNAQAAGGIDFSGSGFLTLAAGKMLGGDRGNVNDFPCPCLAVDYGQGGVYDGRGGLQWGPDSKLGVQGSATFGAGGNGGLSLTGQAVARGARGGRVNLEWLYGSYEINEKFTLQAGRKRLPLFYYSDVQDIGFALPWVHLPPAVYGWEAVNYNGVNLLWHDQWGHWSSTLNLLAGSESRRESGYWKIYNGRRNRTDVRWGNIAGGDLTLQRDWFEARFVFMQSTTQTKNVSGAWDAATQSYDPATIDDAWTPSPAARQRIHGAAFNADYRNWLVRSEFVFIDRPGNNWKDFSQNLSLGYRYGKWQPMATWSSYHANAVTRQGAQSDAQEAWTVTSLVLRRDLGASSALKLQYDNLKEQGGPNWQPRYGNARLLTLSYELVF